MFIVFILGTAGSGKSLLTASFYEWLRRQRQNVATVNLDPGVTTLPYVPSSDVRDYINLGEIMDADNLGPNGALIKATDLIAEEEELRTEILSLKADIVLVDTPGQMELFSFRASGQYIVNELKTEAKATVYLFDSVFSLTPLNFVSNLFLTAAVYNRLLIPQIHVLSKSDLIPNDKVEQVIDWSTDPTELEMAIEQKLEGTNRLLGRDVMHAIYRLGLGSTLIPISAKTNLGFNNLSAALERIFTGGERLTF